MSSNTNIGNTPVNQGYVQLIHTGETGGIDGTLRTLYDGDGTASDLQIASNKVKVSTELYIGSKTATEFIQDIVGDMFTTGSYTNITTTYDDTNGNIDLSASGEVTLTGSQTLTNKTLASPTFTGTANGANLTITGDLTVNGTTTTLDTTNLKVTDNLIELNQGVSSNANDSGIIIERGSTGDNAIIMWDESADKFTLGTTTATADATGNITITTGTLVASTFEGNLTGDVTGNADTATKIASITNSNIVQLTSTQTLTNKTLTSPIIDSVTISTITTSAESFTNNDTSLMTSAAIDDLIISKGYGFGNGDITEVSAGNGLSGGGLSGSVSLAFDGSELADMTEAMVSTDEFVVLDGTTSKRKAISEIKLTDFDDTGFSTGTITSATNMSNNRILTASGSTTINGEANFTIDGTSLQLGDNKILSLGNSDDLQIHHTPNHNYIDINNGNLYFRDDADNNIFIVYREGGGIQLSEGDLKIPATSRLYLDGGSHTYLSESSADILDVFVGGTRLMQFREESVDKVRLPDNIRLGIGNADDLQLYHTSGATYVSNSTGMFTIRNTASNQDIRFSVNDGGSTSNILTLNAASSRVGIGTTAPGEKLDLRGGNFRVGGFNTGSDYGAIFTPADSASYWHIYNDTNGELAFGRSATIGSSEKMRIDSSGNVGIGTSSPQSELNVKSDTNSIAQETLSLSPSTTNSSQGGLGVQSGGLISLIGNNVIAFRTGGGTGDTEAMRIDSSQNVGIGTNSPAHKLEVEVDTNVFVGFDNSIGGTTGDKVMFVGWGGSNAYGRIQPIHQGTAYKDLVLNDSGGNVGIGTTSPSKKLHIKDSTNEIVFIESSDANADIVGADTGGSTRFRSASGIFQFFTGGSASNASASGSSFAMEIDENQRVGIGTSAPAYKLDVAGQGKVTNGWLVDNGTTAGFFTTDTDNVNFGASTSGKGLKLFSANTEAMRINSSQNVGIGTTSPDAKLEVSESGTGHGSGGIISETTTHNGNAGYRFRTNGTDRWAITTIGTNGSDLRIRDVDGSADRIQIDSSGDLHCDQDVVAFSTTPSDKRLKTNIKDINYGLETIMKLNPKQYDWKKDDTHDIGFIAQEVEKVIPEIVKDKKHFDKEIKTLDYEKLTAVLIKAVQEQQEQINELKEKLNG